jgi:hypothetical protein
VFALGPIRINEGQHSCLERMTKTTSQITYSSNSEIGAQIIDKVEVMFTGPSVKIFQF